uniref:Uncharacterized protein n=1 Tax=Anguilla anguilla TaxID=7936 RepID=A0A0E9T874_ANGAN
MQFRFKLAQLGNF